METEKEKSKIPVIGSSLINHNVRTKLKLTVSEYVMLQFFESLFTDAFVPDEHVCMSALGATLKEVEAARSYLTEKGYLQDGVIPYNEWFKAHKEKGFEFALFYQPVVIQDTQISWRNSSKEGAKRKLPQVLKATTIERIIYSKLRYFISRKESKSLDYMMLAETYLGPDKHYMIDYALKPENEALLADYILNFYNENCQVNLMGFVHQGIPVPEYSPKMESKKSTEDFFK